MPWGSSKFLLVVPNRNTSVYTRLWCGYEAYLAFQSNTIIQTATPPIWPQVVLAWLLTCPALLVAVIVGMLRIEKSETAMLFTPGACLDGVGRFLRVLEAANLTTALEEGLWEGQSMGGMGGMGGFPFHFGGTNLSRLLVDC